MSKSRPAHAPHTLRTTTWGDADLTLTQNDSGVYVLITTAFTSTNSRTASFIGLWPMELEMLIGL